MLRDFVTIERLRSYLAVNSGDLACAFRLYEWNLQASVSVLGLTSIVEVVVRNALDRELRAWSSSRFGDETWFDHVRLDRHGADALRTARDRATRFGRAPEIHGKVIAELPLGFWRFLVESRYLTALWMPALHKAFPYGDADPLSRQRAVAHLMRKMQFVRNRVAHHEPIHRRDLHDDFAAASSLTAWVSPHTGAWLQSLSTLRDVVASKP